MGKPAFIVAGSHSLSVSSPKLKANSLKLPFNSVILKVVRDHIVQFYLYRRVRYIMPAYISTYCHDHGIGHNSSIMKNSLHVTVKQEINSVA